MTAGAVLALIKALGGSGGGGGSSGGGALMVNIDTSTMALDKTWSEINTAYTAGRPVLISYSAEYASGTGSVIGVESSDDGYAVYSFSGGATMILMAQTENGYPVITV